MDNLVKDDYKNNVWGSKIKLWRMWPFFTRFILLSILKQLSQSTKGERKVHGSQVVQSNEK